MIMDGVENEFQSFSGCDCLLGCSVHTCPGSATTFYGLVSGGISGQAPWLHASAAEWFETWGQCERITDNIWLVRKRNQLVGDARRLKAQNPSTGWKKTGNLWQGPTITFDRQVVAC
ncbi:hypothetical protein GE21DRAFT_1957 [Neurospora crassa]|uniref:Uncharacterized protein n=1 Tax=Neurospora crassa (strain ATCC 24698 / 74-OR23-1A / CBS 708.71 / DSM 1257 / FGSC 987) TaxID=367110 RepID=Q7SDR7_NEUCR|nr:hypothetical protein NCU00756 [Neurospora crassa OR74A]EAA34917.3 hypothetical protein NCU00756 [Neurospora crassa OR74A]KHE83687.1 hypothetical protein GE21DRAFT_1957 [Neurospora crassa]|eukprot:XP_964153.3 hypothetical protein NCU00756 [Neurospora crassa OR74A]